jgi:alcohol dehydrogenase (cytochrome c)
MRLLIVPASAAAVLVAVLVSVPNAQQGGAAGAYTQAQADAGRTAYDVSCAGCHSANLTGSSDAPPLTGPNFSNAWGSRPVNELFSHVMQTMPPGSPGSLGEEVTLNVVAYLIQRMGGAPGNQPLTIKTPTTWNAAVAARGNAPPSMALGAGTGSGQGRGGASSLRGVTVRGEVKNYVPVTPEMLKNPPPGDWLIFRRNYHGWSYSPLDQITRENVQDLKLAWVWAMNDTGANQTTPIVHNGIMYLASPSNIVQALDAKTGTLIWETRVGPDQAPGYGGIRSIAIAQDKVLLPTSNAHMVALSARDGDILWDTPLSDVNHPSTSGAIVIGNNVLQGMTGCGRNTAADGCYISAIDINTGKRAWRFYTIPREGEPGYETWGKLPKESRAGVETWIAGSYDPELNLTYWGTAQSKPWSFLNRGTTPFDKTLYANSTLALNADTGKLSWYFQHAPGESFDLDEVFERVLVDVGTQKVSFSAGKAGILWKLDRRTGQYLGHKEMVKQTIWERIDPKTGQPSYRPDILEMQFDQTLNVCPSTAGGKNWGAMSYHQPSSVLIVPLSQSCMDFTVRKTQEGGNGAVRRFMTMPNTNDHLGKLAAYDVKSMQEVWSHTQRASYLTGVVSTAGGIAIVGDIDRNVRAHDVRSGKVLWETRLGTSVQGFPITYSVDGKQYIAVAAGLGGGSPRNVPAAVASEIKIPQAGQALYVFTLPERK